MATGAERPVCVLLLPRPAAAYAPGAALLRAPGAVAVEPPPLSYAAQGRVPGALADRIAAAQARRLALPGEPRAVVAFEALQYPLARALLALHDGAELWYGGAEAAAGRRRALHAAAAARAALTFVPGEDSRPLLARMEALGIESGRLGSER